MESKSVPAGCLTAIVTPFNPNGSVDWPGLQNNIKFQISQGVQGVVPVGTTGESPTLTPEEHALVLARTVDFSNGRIFILAGCGSNSTEEALHYTGVAAGVGCDGVLLVDCYYNGPSSLELRKEYYGPIAAKFPELNIVSYVITGRTGCALSVEDLAILAWKYPNFIAVKDANGDLERMRRTRELVPPDFKIFSGDDDITFSMMTIPNIGAEGVISVIANIAPWAVQQMCKEVLGINIISAANLRNALDPLFRLVSVTTPRQKIILGQEVIIVDKFRNPVPIKTMMRGLGMPAGVCRRPLGRMTPQGVEEVRNGLKNVWQNNPEILKPIEDFYGVSISERLADDIIWQALSYQCDPVDLL